MAINLNSVLAKAKAKQAAKHHTTKNKQTSLNPEQVKALAEALILEHSLGDTPNTATTAQNKLDMVSALIKQAKEKSTK